MGQFGRAAWLSRGVFAAVLSAGAVFSASEALATDFVVTDDASLRAALDPTTGAKSGDTIGLAGNITLTGDLPAVPAGVSFIGNGFTVSGGGQYGGLVVNSGSVQVNNLTFSNTTLTINGGAVTSNTMQVDGTVSGAAGADLHLANGPFWVGGNAVSNVASDISGPGRIYLQSGTLNLTGQNSYTGGTTVTAGSTLQGSASGIQGLIFNNGQVAFNLTVAQSVFNGNLDGTGSVTVDGAGGTLFLTGQNLFSGGLTIGAATVVNFDGAAALGSGPITLQNGVLQWGTGVTDDISARLVFSPEAVFDTNGNDVAMARSFDLGEYGFEKDGAGTLTLTGDVSMRTLNIEGGIVQIGTGGASGTLTNKAVYGQLAGLIINRSDAYTYTSFLDLGSFGAKGGGALTVNLLGGIPTSFGLEPVGPSNLGDVTIDGGSLTVNAAVGVSATSVVNNGGLTVNLQAQAAGWTSTIGAMSGSGSVVFSNAAPVVLSGDNTYTGATTLSRGVLVLAGANANAGGMTIAQGATLQVGNGAARGSIEGDILNSGAVQFAGTSDTTINANISGSGTLAGTGGGVVSLRGNNTYTGGTTITSGLINFRAASAFGAGAITLNGGGLQWANGTATDISSRLTAIGAAGGVFDTNGNTVTLAGALTGAGGVTKAGAGVLTLAGANTYAGGTTVTGGLVNFASPASLGSGAITLNGGGLQWASGAADDVSARLAPLGANGGVFDTNGNTVTLASALTGPGGLTKQGAGTLILTGANTYAGSMAIAAGGTLQIGAGGTSGAIAGGAVANDGSLVVNRSDTLTLSGPISGSGGLTLTGGGKTILTGANSYAGATTISHGTLQIGAGGATGSLGGGAVVNDGDLIFTRSDPTTIANTITGKGNLTFSGSGAVTLTGANSFGSLTIDAGSTVQVGDGAADGSLAGNLIDNGTLIFNPTGPATFGGLIAGSGNIVKQGAGRLNLTGMVLLSNGDLTIQQGRVSINGSFTANQITIDSGGELGGAGAINANVVHAGLAAPGNSIGVLRIGGNYAHSGTFEAEVSPEGVGDQVVVAGRAQVSGAVQVVAAPGRYPMVSTYALLRAAGGLTGTYGSVTSNYPFLRPSLSYDPQTVYLTLKVGGFAAAAQTPAEAAVARVLDSTASAATGDYATVLGGLATASLGQGRAALEAMSGRGYGGVPTAALQGAQLFLRNFDGEAGGTGAWRGDGADRAGGAWITPVTSRRRLAATAGAPALHADIDGLAGGADREVAPGVRAGVAGGYQRGRHRIEGADGQVRSDTFQLAAYGQYRPGPAYLHGVAGYAHASADLERSVDVAGLTARTARGDVKADEWFAQVEAGRRLVLDPASDLALTPFAGLQGVTIRQRGFDETGAGALNLRIGSRTVNSLRSVLGARLETKIKVGAQKLVMVEAGLGWAHEHADRASSLSASLAGAQDAVFPIDGVRRPRDETLATVAVSAQLGARARAYLSYGGSLNDRDDAQSLSVGMRTAW